MKETINVNIASQAFVIDCDAYEVLKRYLDDIQSRLPDDEGETMADVESRIAEIFRDKLTSPMMVVSVQTVRQAMAQMGRPEEFGSPRREQGAHTATEECGCDSRLYRPVEGRSIGGVCAGIARYFGLDTLLVRVVAVLLFCVGGLSLWVYIILWIIMPSERRVCVSSKCNRNS